MKKIVVVVGSGFSLALTGGSAPLVGRGSLPTLAGLAGELLDHITQCVHDAEDFSPVSSELVQETLTLLQREARTQNFEEIVSKLQIRSSLLENDSTSVIMGKWPSRSLLRCLLFFLYDLFARRLSYEGKRQANRNFFYKINDPVRAEELRRQFYRLVDGYDVTFVSFNYDGLIEAFLDCVLGKQPPVFRYFPEISHGVSIVMPENYLSRDVRDFTRWKVPLILKPHGSIHFFRAREDINSLRSSPELIAVQPRPDLGFNPATMQRDIPDQDLLRFADPVPFIVPPVMNKESYFDSGYAKTIWARTVRELSDAEAIIGVGFSIPRSDLHVATLFEAANTGRQRIAICYRSAVDDVTQENWARAFPGNSVEVLTDTGIPNGSAIEIQNFWDRVGRWLNGVP
jgi:hypothetical protein